MEIDVLIVGQGLAGSLLAWELAGRGLAVCVVDNGLCNASRVAAGLVNPVSGRRLVLQPNIAGLLPAARHCYGRLARFFGDQFFVERPMWKILSGPAQKQQAERRLQQAEYAEYLQATDIGGHGVVAPFGILRQLQTGYLKTEALLDALRAWLLASGAYRQAEFDYAAMCLEPDLRWRDIKPKRIVFCEGYLAQANPWFGRLPFQPAKGVILNCTSQTPLPSQILNYGHWLLPLTVDTFKTGATFDPLNLNLDPEPTSEKSLLADLHAIVPDLGGVRVIRHQAGIRPATLDKEPLIGRHPRYSGLYIFNGFGAKGSLLIPWYAARFADYLQQRMPLPPACDIKRYYASHFSG
ncbi:NAD(P)/FAD-dependent oxidoreductase [Methylomonas koyamae]|uniref:FAD-dependent oxidoreductase n=1 Tax=Methylomonas koyamae TaxID=702114 RepID=A0A291IK57_9GAMM|nr:FAD-binding oxidoreductase [Methylomonas koyamae]ATG90571.1 FAD-dependent oxidoreductase [Methylomonas koyamae]OAI30029.1 FAD-dependent oxidoreductase [Methylomonas koyamae]